MSFSKQLTKLRKEQAKDDLFLQGFMLGRVFTYDMGCIALGRMNESNRDGYFKELLEKMKEAELDYGELLSTDSKDDRDLWYSGKKLDDELELYVGDNFEPMQKRYGFMKK